MIKLGKKLFILSVSGLLMSAALHSVTANAASDEITLPTTSGTFTYEVEGGSITITDYEGSTDELDIPALFSKVTSKDLTINTIARSAFEDIDTISKVILPSTVATIDIRAFYGCGGLTTISFDSATPSLSSINNSAFYNCSALTNFTLPDSLTNIGTEAFRGTALKSVSIPENCVTIANKAFYDSSLTTLEFVESDASNTLSIGESAFWGTGITSVTIPDRMTGADGTIVIPDSLFSDCEALTTVTLPDNCTIIGASSFYHCNALTSIDLPKQLTNINRGAFQYSGIKNITIPATVTTIGEQAFRACNNLGTVNFLGNPGTISNNTFSENNAKNVIFYCDPDDNNVIAQATAHTFPYQYHTDKLSFETQPSKTSYSHGDALDYTTGLKLNAVLTSDPENTWTCDDTAIANCTVTGFDSSKVGKQTITIAYGGATITYDVNVYYPIDNATKISISSIANGTYNPNSPYEPEVTLKNKVTNVSLEKGTHYNVTYANNDKAGTATVTITGIESANYKGTVTKEYTINKKNLYEEDITATVTEKTYSGSQIKPTIEDITLTYGDTTLTPGTDYQLCELNTYGSNVYVGEGTVVVEGLNNYTGTRSLNFKIKKKNLADEDIVVEYSDKATYNGSAQTPAVTVKYGELVLTQGTDYTVSYKNNTGVGEGTIIITALEDTLSSTCNYTGSIEKKFTIEPAELTADMATVSKEVVYTGKNAAPEVNVTFNNATLVKDTDYTVTCESVNAGKATVTIEGKGNYKGTVSKEFTITAKSLETAVISDIASSKYTGEAIEPTDFTVKVAEATLTSGTDYTISYENNVYAGTATVTITGKGNYTGTATASFRIVGISLSGPADGETTTSSVSLDITQKELAYTGSELCPDVVVTYKSGETTETLVKDTDYTVIYENNTACGAATVTITGKGKYEGSLTENFTIVATDISKAATVNVSSANTIYNGEAIAPDVFVTGANDPTLILSENTDYTVDYVNNINAGTATITITGINNYTGTIKKDFIIGQKDISYDASISDIPASVPYTGKAVTLNLNVGYGMTTLTEQDYEISYRDNDKIGTATVTVAFKGNYTGSITKSFSITATNLSSAVVSGIADTAYNGSAVTHNITVTLNNTPLAENKDYTVTYKNNTAVGTATVTITGIGKYSGVIEKNFNIVANDLSSAIVSGINDSAYTGAPITQPIVVMVNGSALTENVDYTVAYSNNENAGTATVIITGIGKYSGTVSRTFAINPVAFADSNVTLNTADKVYPADKPEIDLEINVANVVLTENVDYTLTFANQNKPGVATVTATGIGNYTGSVSKTFTITPKKVKINTVKNDTGKKLVTKWKKELGVTGYEISIATNKKFKSNKQVKNTKSNSYTFKKLTKNKYFVRVRAYVKVNGKKVYGEYSSVKTVKLTK